MVTDAAAAYPPAMKTLGVTLTQTDAKKHAINNGEHATLEPRSVHGKLPWREHEASAILPTLVRVAA